MTQKINAAEHVHICPKYEKAISILGKRWTGLIIKALMDGSLRFNELLKIVGTVSDRVLTERLRELETEGLLERLVHPDSPVRIEYMLTPKGRSMEQVLDALQDWANKWVSYEPSENEHIYEEVSEIAAQS
ncbi:helix-turn-helix domain-containing protein [Candidatus Chlorohelix sp.]|uniref:winged helix-turn-helix transcriptional regulator n=1 Tax=Candidatus Chlorohelix sp. TaxID=3139201 RepID=UPI003057D27C